MSSQAQCAALNAAMTKKGITPGAIATSIGATESHVTDVLSGKVKPTEAEFNSIARVLGITSSSVPHTGVHATT